MKHHDDPLIMLLATANPAADTDDPPVDVMSAGALLDVLDERIGTMQNTKQPHTEQSHTDGRWRGPAVALAVTAVAVVIAVPAILFLGGGDDGGVDAGDATSVPTTVTASGEPDRTTDAANRQFLVSSWNPILANTVAGTAPTAATCPEGSTPDIPGDPDQVRPGEGPWSNQAAAFDTHEGRIVFVDADGLTWAFDVCTNTWARLTPEGERFPDWDRTHEIGPLVYDADSDQVISLGPTGIWVLDADAGTWILRSGPDDTTPELDHGVSGAVYDPVSGLVVVALGDGPIMAYDVDTDTWTTVGELWCSWRMLYDAESQQWDPAPPDPGCWSYLIGHTRTTDQLVLAVFQDDGALVDARTGAIGPVGRPDGGIAGGFGSFSYAVGGDTAHTFGSAGVCRLDPETLDWGCVGIADPLSPDIVMPSAMVFDPINERVVVINDFCCNWPGATVTNEVVAVDFASGEVIELLPSNSTRTAD